MKSSVEYGKYAFGHDYDICFPVVDRTEARLGNIRYSVRLRKNRTEYLQDKIKDERILRSFLENFFLNDERSFLTK